MNIKQRCLKYLLAMVLLVNSISLFAAEPDWRDYNQILRNYVKVEHHFDTPLSWVDYSRLKQDPAFAKVVGQIEHYPISQLVSKEEKLAFYINVYNILALKTVLDHWPLESIKDVGSFIYPVWYRDAGTIDGKTVTLNEIEHKVLRPMGEPRIHFAIVCASISCPDLRNEAYTASKLNQQLEDQTQRFLDNPAKGLNSKAQTLRVSQIFDWFEDDFAQQGGVETFIRHYKKLPEKITLKANLPYNWSVNGE